MPEYSLIQKIIIWAVPVIFAITVHEVAHGWVANKLGDSTARILGRLTLNPMKHIDPVGTIVVPLILLYVGNFIFGWAKPVPVDWRNLHRPRRDMALVAIAGPAANLLMIVLWAVFAKIIMLAGNSFSDLALPLFYMCSAGILINTVVMVLNLFPLPPLDGSRVMSAILPPAMAYKYNQLERFGLLILIALLATGVLGKILGPIVFGLQQLIYSLLSI